MATSLPFETVDAFTAEPFAGNPAAVLVFPLASPPALQQLSRDDALMQKIAAEFNLSETAFCVELEGGSDEGARTVDSCEEEVGTILMRALSASRAIVRAEVAHTD